VPRTCFVISPIGDQGSDTRKLADDLLDLIIDPALESLGFEVIRADRIIGSGTITAEVVHLVQNAELCIIDLTGHNANVFYECGRRHETARPFIQVIQRGEKPPFDVAGIRTIYYDLSDAREVRNTVLEVRKYAEAVVRSPSETTRTSMSATSIADALDRLERKVDQLYSTQAAPAASPTARFSADPLMGFQRSRNVSPTQMYLQAMSQGNFQLAANAVELLREKHGLEAHVVAAAMTVAAVGMAIGATIVYEVLDSLPNHVDEDDEESNGKDQALIVLANYYMERDEQDIGLAKLRDQIAEVYSDPTVPDEMRAQLANVLQQLAYAVKDYALAAEWGERACEIGPEDAYWTNLSMDYEGLNNMVKAKDAVDRALHDPLEDSTSHTLGQAIDIYSELGDEAMVDRLYGALHAVDPEKATYKQFLRSLDEQAKRGKRKK
jgi:tetratricopeptide (TPR) repeat protein